MLILCATLFAASDCYDPQYSDETRCGGLGECPSGRVCRDQRCVLLAQVVDAAVVLDAPQAGIDAPLVSLDAAPPDGPSRDASSTVLIQVTKTGSGTVTVSGSICDIDCPALNVYLARHPSDNATATARPAPGYFFRGWGGACTSVSRDCTISRNADAEIAALFEPITANLIFISSRTVAGDFADGFPIDRLCTDMALEAGLIGTWRTLVTVNPNGLLQRLEVGVPPARGFMRMDGQYVADTAEDLVRDHTVRYPILYDERGEITGSSVWTGALVDGTLSQSNCNDWSRKAGTGDVGNPNSGPRLAKAGALGCSSALPVICVMTDFSVVAPPLARPGNRWMFVSGGTVVGASAVGTGNVACNAVRTGSRALLATSQRAASELLTASEGYWRSDGVYLGTGAEIAQRGPLSGIWTTVDGKPTPASGIWTGSVSIGSVTGNGAQNCDDWTATGVTGVMGLPSGDIWWRFFAPQPCTEARPVYCADP